MARPTATPGTILITGGTRGIGAAIARELATTGRRIIVTSRSGDGPPPAPGVTVLPLEVRDAASVAACLAAVVADGARLEAVVHNAGYDLYGAIEDTTWAEFHDQLDTNLFGVVRVTQAALPYLRAARGRLVAIGSLGGRIGLPLNGAYAASKFALEGLMESLRLELRPHGVHVSIVVPPAVATDTHAQSNRIIAAPSRPYAARLAAMAPRMREEGERSPVTPAHVARAVRRAIEAPAPTLAYPVGAQAQVLPRLKALLPQRLFEALMVRIFPDVPTAPAPRASATRAPVERTPPASHAEAAR